MTNASRGDSDDTAHGAGEQPGPEQTSTAAEDIRQMLRGGSGLARDMLELLSIESRLAGRSLALMLSLAIVLALMIASTWLLLNLALGLWLQQSGWTSLPTSLVLVAVANGVFALILWLAIHSLSRNLSFPTFVQALKVIFNADDRRPEP